MKYNRDVDRGFYLFLESEKMRHQEDINHIERTQLNLSGRMKLSLVEQLELESEALNHVRIEEVDK